MVYNIAACFFLPVSLLTGLELHSIVEILGGFLLEQQSQVDSHQAIMLATVIDDETSAQETLIAKKTIPVADSEIQETAEVQNATEETRDEEMTETAAKQEEKPIEMDTASADVKDEKAAVAEGAKEDGSEAAKEVSAQEAEDVKIALDEVAADGIDAVPALMDKGKKDFALQNWESAVQVFGKVAELL